MAQKTTDARGRGQFLMTEEMCRFILGKHWVQVSPTIPWVAPPPVSFSLTEKQKHHNKQNEPENRHTGKTGGSLIYGDNLVATVHQPNTAVLKLGKLLSSKQARGSPSSMTVHFYLLTCSEQVVTQAQTTVILEIESAAYCWHAPATTLLFWLWWSEGRTETALNHVL